MLIYVKYDDFVFGVFFNNDCLWYFLLFSFMFVVIKFYLIVSFINRVSVCFVDRCIVNSRCFVRRIVDVLEMLLGSKKKGWE